MNFIDSDNFKIRLQWLYPGTEIRLGFRNGCILGLERGPQPVAY